MKENPVIEPELDFFTLLNPDFGRKERKDGDECIGNEKNQS
ncbi:hypothetical protein [Halobacillus yeomjeoni]|nr:hypothetical protein [Halobacillus yeomjeoni]